MCITDKKYYLRPTGYLSKSEAHYLKKKNKVIEINDSFYSSIELISRERKIKKSLFSIDDFVSFINKKNNKNLTDKFNILTKKKNF